MLLRLPPITLSPLKLQVNKMQHKSIIWIFIPIVFGIPISFWAVYLYYDREYAKLPVYEKEVTINDRKEDDKIAAFEFTNQDSKILPTDHWNEKVVVVDFFFTHCTAVCPKMTRSLKKVQEAYDEKEIAIISFSVDPERDNPGQLKNYAGKFQINTTNWQLLTGDKKEIYKLARNRFMVVATDGDGGDNDFIHSEKLILLDKQKRIRGYYNGTNEQEVSRLILDIKKLHNEK